MPTEFIIKLLSEKMAQSVGPFLLDVKTNHAHNSLVLLGGVSSREPPPVYFLFGKRCL